MLKLPKGLKKKKKGKKSKHKDDELFTKEELEAYRREHAHQQQVEPVSSDVPDATAGQSSAGEKEEWRKFLSLTSDVDDILKKTSDDLDRIKSSSFFQRVPLASEVRKQEEEKEAEARAEEEAKEEEKRLIAAVEAAIVEVSESESGDDEDEDDIFDTAYIDAVAAGEVKLAYIPESPTDEGDDIFDTTYAEKAILGPNSERKGKKLVPLGSAVEILTGRVQAPSCVAVKRPTARRQVFKEQNLLLSSFDADQPPSEPTQDILLTDPGKPSLLDDDAPEELGAEPIDLAKVIVTPLCAPAEPHPEESPKSPSQDILAEFGVLQKVQTPEDEDDQEFALLAAESLSKPTQSVVLESTPRIQAETWNAFGQEGHKAESDEEPVDDPFDTTFAENILPGQAELKQIEREILDEENDLDFNPRADEVYTEIIRRSSIGVSIHLTNPSGQRESVSSLDRVNEDQLNTLKTSHRDLLGGSNTDLSQLTEAIQPEENEENEEEDNFDYSDPFDTSAIEAVALPGTTELKFLERELLGEQVAQVQAQPPARPVPPVLAKIQDNDEDFDPRSFDNPQPTYNRKVSFDLPLPKTDLLSANDDDSKISKPLTPYYVRENSIPQAEVDPFDTTFAESLAPGQAELKQIESALLESEVVCDFNPRDEKQVAVAKVKEEIEQIIRAPRKPSLPFQPASLLNQPKPPSPEPLDLLGLENDICAKVKVLTPSAESKSFEDYIDPFDTSIASNILPGQTELRLLESELITNYPPVPVQVAIKRNLTDPDFDPRDAPVPQNILEAETGQSDVKLLTPITGKVSFDVGFDEQDDIDPFDTSIANNIAPGPSELKLLESELI